MNNKITTFKNGFQIISLPKINSNLVSLGMLINEIPKYLKNTKKEQNNNESGVAHFLEHMCFKGTKKYPYQNFIKIIEKNNFNVNAYTSKEHSLFSINCLNNAKNIYKSLDLLKEMIFHPRIDINEIESEKTNIRAELIKSYEKNVIEGNLKDLILEFGHRIIYEPNTHLNRNILGDLHIINSMTRNKLINYHKKYFIPSNSKLIIAGIEPKMNKYIHKYIIKQYSDIFNKYSLTYNNSKINYDYKIKEKFSQEQHFILKSGNNSGVGIFFSAPSYSNIKNYFIFLILEKLLGQYNGIGKGINLNETINNINIINKDIFYIPYKDNGLFGLILISNNNNLNSNFVEKYLFNILKNHMNENEIQKAKNKLIWDLLGIESVSSLMNLTAIQCHYYNKILRNKYIINLIKRIKKEDIFEEIIKIVNDFKNKKYNIIFIDNLTFQKFKI